MHVNHMYLIRHGSKSQRVNIITGLWAIAIVLILLVAPIRVQAHPQGDFNINRYSRLELGLEKIRIHYIVDMDDIAALQEFGRMDLNGDDTVGKPERKAYLKSTAERLRQGLDLRIDGIALSLEPVTHELNAPSGQADPSTLRLKLVLDAQLSEFRRKHPLLLEYQDNNHKKRPGWKEIVALPMPGVDILSADVPREDRSDELRRFPRESLHDPLDVQRASVTFKVNTLPLNMNSKK